MVNRWLKVTTIVRFTPSNRMTASDAAAVYDAGWNDEALLHAIAVCAYFRRASCSRECDGT